MPSMESVTLRQLLEEAPDDGPAWLVDRLLPAVGCAFLAAPAKNLKSWLALQLCLAVAGGNEFLGRPVTPATRRVVYIAGEGGEAALKKRFIMLGNGHGIDIDQIADRVHLVPSPRVLLNRSEDLTCLMRHVTMEAV